MIISATSFDDLFIIEPNILSDARGYFMESYNYRTLAQKGIELNFVQDNQSKSGKGVLRGLHFQNAPYAQTKLIRVLFGAIWDVVVDLRVGKPTYSKYFGIELSAENHRQLLVPKGFAHGFIVLSETSEILYKCDEYYHPKSEGGIIFNDPDLSIDWKFNESEIILSERDRSHPKLLDAQIRF